MASYARIFTLPPAEKDDTWVGQEFVLYVNDAVKDLTSATIELTLDSGDTLTTTDGDITITDASNGEFKIDSQVITFSAGVHKYEIKFTFSDGEVKTYIKGHWTITA